jgi:hypothetical protein
MCAVRHIFRVLKYSYKILVGEHEGKKHSEDEVVDGSIVL